MGIFLLKHFKGFKSSAFKSDAFSFVELLITLIILSLIMAAFIPLITKKLKANDITVGSFGNGGGGGAIGIKRNVTKQDCDKFNAIYIEASKNDGIKPICVTKYNMGDNGLPINGVSILSAGNACTNQGNCCWNGATAATGKCGLEGNTGADYSGCNRTVCQWQAAKLVCQLYAPEGTRVGSWRLPNTTEAKGWIDNLDSINNNKGKEGLQLCSDPDVNAADGFVKCAYAPNNCKNAAFNHCIAGITWLNEKESMYALYHNKSVLKWGEYESGGQVLGNTRAFSVRCVLDSISDIVPTGEGTDVIDNKLDSQADCDKLGAGLLFVPKEDTGTKNMCVMKYNIGDMGNENWAGVQRCSAGSACTVENGNSTKVTKDNLTPTCWQGKTGGAGCNDEFGGYDGCRRTVCNWTGANKLCENYRLGTYGWRLPTKSELISFTNETYSSKTAFESGNGSLMLCNHSESSISPQCQYLEAGCSSTQNGGCNPAHVWSSSFSSVKAWTRYLHGSWSEEAYYLGHGFSTRCVLDEDAYRHANTNQIMPTETEFSSSCENGCALCGNDKCYACKKGYELTNGNCAIAIENCEEISSNGMCLKCKNNLIPIGKKCVTCEPANGLKQIENLCVTQYNIGDDTYNESWQGVQRCHTGHACFVEYGGKKEDATENTLQPTCWQGNTANSSYCNAKFGGYSGCNRTQCNWTGGKKMCENIGWRMPTMNELKTFTSTTYSNNTLASNGLMLCDDSTKTTVAPMCQYRDANLGACVGSYDGHCGPYRLWSSSFTSDSSSQAQNRDLTGSWTNFNSCLGTAFSVRCVYDL